jgi:hypothetical protein
MMMARVRHLGILVVILCSHVSAALATSFTLSDAGIMALDYDNGDRFVPSPTAYIVDRRDVPGPGVEFDIAYPGNDNPDDFLYWISDFAFGAGALAGIDITPYENFELSFALLSANGSLADSGPMIVGAFINYAHHPDIVDLDPNPSYPSSVISSTPINVSLNQEEIDAVGFYTWLWLPNDWSPDGNTITLLVEPAPGAVPIPEPAAGLFLLAVTAWTAGRRGPARPCVGDPAGPPRRDDR